METLDHAMVINEKDFDNALDFAIQKRKFVAHFVVHFGVMWLM